MNVLKLHLQSTVFTLLERKQSQREIQRLTGIDRKTIRRYEQLLYRAQAANSPTPATGSEPVPAANSPGVATGFVQALEQTPPPWPIGSRGAGRYRSGGLSCARTLGLRAVPGVDRRAGALEAQRQGDLPGPGGSFRFLQILRGQERILFSRAACSFADDLHRVCRRNDGDTLVAAEREQMLLVAGDDQISVGGDRTGEHMIIIGIVGHHARRVDGFNQFDDLDEIGEHLARALADDCETLGCGRAREHLGQFFEQHRAAKDLHLGLLADHGEQLIGIAAPQ